MTSDSNRDRSSASTWMATRKTEDWVGAHSTSSIRSGCWESESTLTQSARWTETPLPRVTNPMIGSPGTGVQQRASLTQTSSTPLTTTPGSALPRRLRPREGGTLSSMSSLAASSPPRAWTSFCTTPCAATWPSPIAAYREEMSG